MRSVFGWSYPPGCSGPPWDDATDPSPEEDAIYELLEAAQADQDVIDKACKIVGDLAAKAYTECPECMRRAEAIAPEHSAEHKVVAVEWNEDGTTSLRVEGIVEPVAAGDYVRYVRPDNAATGATECRE